MRRGCLTADLLVGLAGLAGLAACGDRKTPAPEPLSDIVVHADSLLVQTGDVGVGSVMETTYVYVDVENRGTSDRTVSVKGVLLDGSGRELASLAPAALRIPAGKRRAFALVAAEAHEDAKAARFEVLRAAPVSPEIVSVKSVLPAREGEYLGVSAVLESTSTVDEVATVVAAFYDVKGVIVARPFTLTAVPAKGTRNVSFPPRSDAMRVEVFVAEVKP